MTTGDQTVAGAKTFSTTIVGDISGNAATATALETGRTIAGNAFDGTDAGSGIIISATERSAIGTITKTTVWWWYNDKKYWYECSRYR